MRVSVNVFFHKNVINNKTQHQSIDDSIIGFIMKNRLTCVLLLTALVSCFGVFGNSFKTDAANELLVKSNANKSAKFESLDSPYINMMAFGANFSPTQAFLQSLMGGATCDGGSNVDVEATGGTLLAGYPTLKTAFDAINAGTHRGTIVIEICSSTTEGTTPATLNSNDAGAASYTSINIHPINNNLSINGNPAAGFGVIQFKSSDNVTIDGDNPNVGGLDRSLTINNTNASTVVGGSVIRIANLNTIVTFAHNITIKNLKLNGNVTSGNAPGVTDNTGSADFSFGIYAGGNGGSTLTDEPTAITSPTDSPAAFGTEINDLVINNNVINQTARGIVFNGAASTVSHGLTITNNIIGASGTPSPATPPFTSPATTVYSKGIWIAGANDYTVSGNTVQNIMSYLTTTPIHGIEINDLIGAGTQIINNNTVSGIAQNAATLTQVKGILVDDSGGTFTVSGNTVSNLQGVLTGEIGNAYVTGIEARTSGTSGLIENNKVSTIHNRNIGSTGSWGINLSSGNNIIIQNNFISDVLGNMSAGNTVNINFAILGIRVASGTGHKIQHNSINMTGAMFGTSRSTLLTSALGISSINQTGMDIRNNIFSNTITGGTTSIAHVSVFLPSNGTSAMNLTLNNNAYYYGTDAARQGVGQAGTITGTNFFTSITNLRNYSSTLSPSGINDTASFATTTAAPFTSLTNLHIPSATVTELESRGASIGVTTDIDGDTRPNGTAPDIGADEFAGTAVDLSPPSIIYTPLLTGSSTSSRTLNVTITDTTNVDEARIYYRKGTSGTYTSAVATSVSNNNYVFTINYAAIGGVISGDVIQYYVAAQDTQGNVSTNPIGGSGVNPPGVTPPSSPNSYTILPPISSYPYSQDFETGANSYSSEVVDNTTNDWILGTPAKTQLNGAHSGTKAWVTKATGNYSDQHNAAVVSPVFDFSSLNIDPTLSFWQNFNITDIDYDSMVLEISTNGGTDWTRVDSNVGTGDTFNTTNSTGWYNFNGVSGPTTGPEWTGTSTAYAGHSSGWIKSTTLLVGMAGQSNVRLRWRFATDHADVGEGFAIDDISVSINEALPPVISYIALSNAPDTSNRTLTISVTDNAGVPTSGVGLPRLYYRNGTSGAYTSTQCSFLSGSNYNCTFDYSQVSGGVSVGDRIQYYVVAQDMGTPNVSVNPSTGANGLTANPPAAATPPTSPNSYLITGFNGTYNVGTGETYTSLTRDEAGGLFKALNNSGALTGDVTINITSHLIGETGAIALNELAGGFELTIQSSTATERMISGSVANGLIRLDGADNIKFDGRLNGSGTGKFLRFRNTNTSGQTFLFQNHATSNTIRYCIIEGANISSNNGGTIVFGASSGAGPGNSNNVILLSDIRDRSDATGIPANAVFSAGSTGTPNSNNAVGGCNIFNYSLTGVQVMPNGVNPGSGWTINDNSFYQTSVRSNVTYGIIFSSGGSGQYILNNYIGGSAPNAGGSFLSTTGVFIGISMTVGSASPSNINNNIVKNIRSTDNSAVASYGIRVINGIANVEGNTIGSSDSNERFEVNGGSRAIDTDSSTVTVNNNTVNNFGTTTSQPAGISYYGIFVRNSGAGAVVSNNTISNVKNDSTANVTSDSRTIGLAVSSANTVTVRGNSISNVGNTATSAVTVNNNRAIGIFIQGVAAGSVVDKNRVTGIYASSPAAGARADIIALLQSESNANVTYTNNMLYTSGGSGNSDRRIIGIYDTSSTSTCNYYFNSVNIFGTATGTNNTYAFNREGTTTVNLRNNIFSNSRTGGTGFHVAIANTNASATGWSSSASNFNLLFNVNNATLAQWLGSGSTNNRSLSSLQTTSGGDANSINANPNFVSPTDLHLTQASPAMLLGTTIAGVTTDVDGDVRPAGNPDIGADEMVQSVASSFPSGTFYNAILHTNDTLAGNVTISNSLTLTGIANAGSNTLTIGCNTIVNGVGTTTYVVGKVAKQFCSAGTFFYPVGTLPDGVLPEANEEYTPVTVNVTALGTNPSTLTVNVTDTYLPTLQQSTAVSRYWTLTETGDLTANLTFQYLDQDINGSEASYKVFKRTTGAASEVTPNNINAGANQASVTGVSSFSDWGIGAALAPTSATGNLGGIVRKANGEPLSNALVIASNLSTGQQRTTGTDVNGRYGFIGLAMSNNYHVKVLLNGFRFNPGEQVLSFNSSREDVNFTASQSVRNPANDYDGDGIADLAVWRPSEGNWYILQSSTNSMKVENWGVSTDIIVPSDYDGDGKMDVAVFRPSEGNWYIKESFTGNVKVQKWGLATDIVVPADYDGDGRTDLAVYRHSDNYWYILRSSDNNVHYETISQQVTKPVIGDFDGDGRADIAATINTSADANASINFVVKNSSNYVVTTVVWGLAQDNAMSGDFDGDGRTDYALYRASDGVWYVKTANDTIYRQWGVSTDTPLNGDFDGDGLSDFVVYRGENGKGYFYINGSNGQHKVYQFGLADDVPVGCNIVR